MQERPNIIVINIDDMGWKDLGCTGSSFYETPVIDRLCREGMNFTNAYASSPVCTPSRASFQTGRHPARIGMTDWIDHSETFHPLKGKLIDAPYVKHMDPTEQTIAKTLKAEGYATWHVGKWHLGQKPYYPENFGFDVNIAGCWWGNPYHGYFSPYGMENLEDGPEGEYLTDRLTDEAIRLIAGNKNQPFFLNFCHYAVHEPIEAKEEDIQRFKNKAHKMGLDLIDPIVEGECFPTLHNQNDHVKRRILQSDPVYAAMIWNLDQNTGRLMQALHDYGKADNTVVIFTSDNGGLATAEGSPTCNYPAREGKGWMYEGGLRVPLIVWYPKLVPAQSVNATPVCTMDLHPTILELCHIPLIPQQHLDGRSFVPLFEGGKMEERPLFWHYPHYGNQGGTPGSSVVLGDDKYIEFFEQDAGELYRLNEDISEIHNRIDEDPETAGRLQQMLLKWQKETGAAIPQINTREEM